MRRAKLRQFVDEPRMPWSNRVRGAPVPEEIRKMVLTPE